MNISLVSPLLNVTYNNKEYTVQMCRYDYLLDGFIDFMEYLMTINIYKNVIEVGSNLGESSAIFSRYFNNVICVDNWSWQGEISEILFDRRISQLPNKNITKVKMDIYQPDVVCNYNFGVLADLVYIDAQHFYHTVKSDILNFAPKVKENGYIGGHDYNFPDVEKAVSELFDVSDIKIFKDFSWLLKKDKLKILNK